MAVALLLAPGCGSENGSEEVIEEPTYKSVLLRDQSVTTSYLSGDKGLYNIYLPSDWETSDKKYPVLYLLHGMYDSNTAWTSHGVQTLTSTAILKDQVVPFIVVMPKAYNSFYVDGLKGYDTTSHDYESFFWKDFVPYIEKTYPVSTDRKETAIAGLSMGGYGAMYYAFKYPEEFCFCYSMSGALTGIGSALTPSMQSLFETYGYNSENFDSLPDFVMDCGMQDYLCGSANVMTDSYLTGVGFPHKYRTSSGTHDWTFWIECYQRLLKDLPNYFGK